MSESRKKINWYPGHMAKTRRQLQDQIRRIDLIMEICDARLPYSSRNPELTALAAGKRHMLFLNKSDLADPAVSAKWISAFRDEGIEAYLMNAARLKSKEIISLIDKATKEIVEKALDKGVRKTVKAMIVGIPNVGKSTLINHLYGRNVSRSSSSSACILASAMRHSLYCFRYCFFSRIVIPIHTPLQALLHPCISRSARCSRVSSRSVGGLRRDAAYSARQ